MDPALSKNFLSLGTFLGMLLFLYCGYFIKRKAKLINFEGLGSIHTALLALLGLLIAFTFTGAYERFDHRRNLIIEEANNIGTAYLRLDLLPEENQPTLREKFRAYTNGRITFYQKLINKEDAIEELEREKILQKDIWNLSVKATQPSEMHSARMLLLPALNQVFDISSTRKNAILTHVPLVIVIALISLSFICSFLIGIGMANSSMINRLHSILFCGIISFFIFIILDIEYPRYGLIRLDKANEALIDVQNGMTTIRE